MMGKKVCSLAVLFFLTAIVGTAFFLRAYRIDFGLPDEYHPDERIVSRQVEGFLNGHYRLERLNHPPLQKNMAFLGLSIIRLFRYIPPEQYWDYSIRAVRWVSVCMGTASIFFLYVLACHFVCRFTALCVALVYAVLPVAVVLSKYGLPDITVSCLMIVCFILVLKMYEKPTPVRSFVTGMCTALACSAKYNGIVVFGSSMCAFIFLAYQWKSSKSRKKLLLLITLFLMGAALGFIAGFPPIQFGGFKMLYQSLKFELRHLFFSGHKGINIVSDGFFFMYHFFYTILPSTGKLLLGWIICGCIYALVGLNKRVLIILSGVVPYYIMMESAYKVPVNAERYMVPILSIFILFAGIFCDKLSSFLVRRLKWLYCYKNYFFIGVLLYTLYMPLDKSLKVLTAMYPDTRLIMKEWIHANVPEGSRIFMQWASSPLYPNLDGMGFSILSNDGIRVGGLRQVAAHADYILASSIIYDRYLKYPEGVPGNTAFYNRLFASGALVYEAKGYAYLYHNPTLRLYRFKHKDTKIQ
ncbi:MAG: glycosyltransferase family 39 protein [bacterium]|nr:glycosyltransferase family 39 protein [bacterium]